MHKKSFIISLFLFLLVNLPAIAKTEQTLSIIKPDAVAKNTIGKIISRFEENGLKVIAIKMIHLTPKLASHFYKEHKGKQFFEGLVKFMTSGPIIVQVLEGENAIQKNRSLMGNTDPQKAASGTIRADFGGKVPANAVHGSDSTQSAKREISFFFKPNEIFK